MSRTRRSVCLVMLACVGAARGRAADDVGEVPHFRRPVGLCAAADGATIAVANRDSGSVLLVSTESWTVLDELDVGTRLSAAAALPDSTRIVVADEAAHEVMLLECHGERLTIVNRLPVTPYPVSIATAADGKVLSVASLWSRTLTLFDITPDGGLRPRAADGTIALPFAPRCQCALPAEHGGILVADSFAGRMAIVDPRDARVVVERTIPAHNIRGLALAPHGRDLYIAHQLLETRAPTTFDSIHWGNLIENVIRVVPVEALLDPQSDIGAAGRVLQLGTTGSGAGDPGGIAFADAEHLIAIASGIDRVHVFPVIHSIITPQIETGRRPTALITVPGKPLAVVANTLGDSLTVIDTDTGRKLRDVSLGETPPESPRERGESLFYDARLSHDAWLSCQSCHTDGHTCGLLSDTHSDGTFGSSKRILSLLGTRDNNPWSWNGSLRSLHDQVMQSTTSSMQGDPLPAADVNDLVAYLHTLPPPPPLVTGTADIADAALHVRGQELFDRLDCRRCHVPPLTFTSDQIVDVGLRDESGLEKFNPPSLRGVGQLDRLFHDGRAASLEEVLIDYGHQLPQGISEEDAAALVRYLKSL